MTDRDPGIASLLVRPDQPLIGIISIENGEEMVRYFADEVAMEDTMSAGITQAALDVIGAWSDLDWNEMEKALDWIRHESLPTPPIEL